MADLENQTQIDSNNHHHHHCELELAIPIQVPEESDGGSQPNKQRQQSRSRERRKRRPPRPRRRPNINWLIRFKYRKNGDPHNEMRNVLLIVSALIAAVTFQAGVNPPGGVWQDSDGGHVPGSAIYATHKEPFYTFLIFNTLALSSSIMVIISLTFMFPFSVEIWIATVSMIVTYGSSVFAITPFHHGNYKFRYILLTAACPIVVRILVEVCRYVKRKNFPDFSL